MASLLAARRTLRDELSRFDRRVLEIVREDKVCRRLMTMPGVGPVVSLAFTGIIDVPARFKNSKAGRPALGLTPVLHRSGESHRGGRVCLDGDGMMRVLLFPGMTLAPSNGPCRGRQRPRQTIQVEGGLESARHPVRGFYASVNIGGYRASSSS